MTIFQSIILGLLQGIAEFLPISSSGHLVLFQQIFGLNEGVLSFDIALHFATLVSVCIVYRNRIVEMIKKPFSKLPMYIVLGTVPIIILGLLFNDTIEAFFENGVTLGFGFIFTGIMLTYADNAKSQNKKIEAMKPFDAIFIGLMQAVAMLPAVSRSGMTISGGLMRGLNKKFAADFAFLLSIPGILGAAVLDLYKMLKSAESFATVGTLPLIIGMLMSGISGYIAIRVMIRIVEKKKLKYFAWYVFALGVLVLLDQFVFNIFLDKII